MNLCEKFLRMSNDARERYCQVHKKDIERFFNVGTRLKIEDSEVSFASKNEMIAFGRKYCTVDKESFEKALRDHGDEAGFTPQHVNFLFGSIRNFYMTIEKIVGIRLRGKLVTDEEFLMEFSRLHVHSVREYQKFLNTPEGDGWPGYTTIYDHYGNFVLFLAAAMSIDLNFQFDMYYRLSLKKGALLTMAECEELNIELEMLHRMIGKENFEKVVEEKIRQYKEGVSLDNGRVLDLDGFLDYYDGVKREIWKVVREEERKKR